MKGMGDKMDWDTHYPGGRSPLDDVQVEAHTEYVGSGLLFNYVEDDPPPVSYTHLTLPTICSV